MALAPSLPPSASFPLSSLLLGLPLQSPPPQLKFPLLSVSSQTCPPLSAQRWLVVHQSSAHPTTDRAQLSSASQHQPPSHAADSRCSSSIAPPGQGPLRGQVALCSPSLAQGPLSSRWEHLGARPCVWNPVCLVPSTMPTHGFFSANVHLGGAVAHRAVSDGAVERGVGIASFPGKIQHR